MSTLRATVSVHDAQCAPLRVTATLAGGLTNPLRPPVLDALLAYAQAVHVELREPALPGSPLAPVAIPLALSACGRFHLASFALAEVESYDDRPRFVNRRFPLSEAQMYGDAKLRTINLSGGPCKSFRIPLEVGHLREDRVTWYALGDPAGVRALLVWITHLGKRRGVGLGKIATWTVETPDTAWTWEGAGWTETRALAPVWRPWEMRDDEPVARWRDAVFPNGAFPVIRNGRPLRNLPLDTMDAELGAEFEGYGNVTFPYFEKHREALCLLAV